MAKAQKLDLYKKHAAEYAASKTQPAMIDVPPVPYLSVEGRGGPGGPAFEAKVAAMCGVAFTVKMTRKFAGKGDYKVCHLEGLWWSDAAKGAAGFIDLPRDQWRWKLLIRVPEFIGHDDVEAARQVLREKSKPPEFEQVGLERIEEGPCVQMLHVGPYANEGQTLDVMRHFAESEGLAFCGRHHEIYLSDPRRVGPERLRTILRMPVRSAG